MTAAWNLRAAAAADLPRLQSLLPAGATHALPVAPHEHWWIAEQASGHALACLRLRPAIGLDLPRHWYHVGCVVHAAPALALFQRQRTLLLGNDHTGAAELADIACDAAALAPHEQAQALQALVRAALAQIAREREAYPAQLIVELPGVRDAAGRSPFWQGLGRHFYEGDPQQAALRFGAAWRSHVAALLPRQPVYTGFLPPEAQAAIGQAAPGAQVLARVLVEAGLRGGHHVTIDDGGPVHEAWIDALLASKCGSATLLDPRGGQAGRSPAPGAR